MKRDPRRNGAGVWRYAVNLARLERGYGWLEEQPDPIFADTKRGKPHAIFGYLQAWEKAASLEEDRLAISPLTRARLGIDLAKQADLAQATSEEDPDRRRTLLAEAGIEEPEEASQ